MLNWDHTKHDFSAIEETLYKYFPIKNFELYNEENVQNFQGFKEIEEILNDNFFTTKNYRERWGKFKKFLKQEFKKTIYESMVAWYPCYSGFIVLQKDSNKNLTYRKELHFFISLLGPYYTILGIDKSEVQLEEAFRDLDQAENSIIRTYPANHVLTVSPYMEYKESFIILQKKILEYFPSLKYVPYQVNLRKVEGISLLYPESEGNIKDSVFSALFKPDHSLNTTTRGDAFYGYDE